MREKDICFLSIPQLSGLIKNREVSPVEVTRAILSRIEEIDPKINAFITLLEDDALESARKAEKAIASGKYLGSLHGVPIALKDIFWLKGVRTTAGSKILADFVPKQDATVVERLKKAGAIFVGTLNLHEFAMGGTSNNPHYGPVRNPWDMKRIPGGSSGGSAAGLAASIFFGSLGTDTGGSIRNPASFCNIVGLKPTYGRVSRHGVIPLSWSLDHIGPMARTVEDAAIILNVIAGHDPKDLTTSDTPVPDYAKRLTGGIKGLSIGIPRGFFMERVDSHVRAMVEKAISVLEELGASIREVSLPHTKLAAPIGTVMVNAEAISYHEPFFDARPNDYGEDVRARLEVGKVMLAKDYLRALKARSIFVREVQEVFRQVEIVVTPTSPFVAPRIGQKTIKINGVAHEMRKGSGLFTRPFNLSGNPAVSVPCGFPSNGLPTGLQIVGRPFEEDKVLRVAYAYESSTPWHEQRPKI